MWILSGESFFFSMLMLKAILVFKAENPQKWDGMISTFQGGKLVVLDHFGTKGLGRWRRLGLQCFLPLTTLQYNSSEPVPSKTVFFLKMKWSEIDLFTCRTLKGQWKRQQLKLQLWPKKNTAPDESTMCYTANVIIQKKVIKMFRSFGTCTVLHHPSSQFVHQFFN